ncbi:MAG: hypothetical protein RL662_2219, partial [Bacteroidota bacterium]
MEKVNYRKIIQTINYFAQKQPDKCMSKMKVYKLLWLADRYHVRQYGRTITGDTYYALPFGLVPSKTKDILDQKQAVLDVLNGYDKLIEVVDKRNYK